MSVSICVHECGGVWRGVPVSVSIQVLCECVCISVDVGTHEPERLHVCIFELMGGDGPRRSPRATEAGARLQPNRPFPSCPSWHPPASGTWLGPVTQPLGHAGASDGWKQKPKKPLPLAGPDIWTPSWQGTAPRDHSSALPWDSSEGSRRGCSLGRGLSLEV